MKYILSLVLIVAGASSFAKDATPPAKRAPAAFVGDIGLIWEGPEFMGRLNCPKYIMDTLKATMTPAEYMDGYAALHEIQQTKEGSIVLKMKSSRDQLYNMIITPGTGCIFSQIVKGK